MGFGGGGPREKNGFKGGATPKKNEEKGGRRVTKYKHLFEVARGGVIPKQFLLRGVM